MPKLTDTQLVILSAAAGRDAGAVLPLPDSLTLNTGAAASVLKGLIKRGLIVERPRGRGPLPSDRKSPLLAAKRWLRNPAPSRRC